MYIFLVDFLNAGHLENNRKRYLVSRQDHLTHVQRNTFKIYLW